MAAISARLRRRLETKPVGRQCRRSAFPSDVSDVQSLVRKGYLPDHACYSSVQQITSYFAESVSDLPELKDYERLVGWAEEEYVPDGPPLSPLTGSYFTYWAFYDLSFGSEGETLGTCLGDVADLIPLTKLEIEALKKLNASRMGVYEQIDGDGMYVRLRELLTGEESTCHSTAGYRGRPGELWYVRVMPPLTPESQISVTVTTPYILIGAGKDEWERYLRRNMTGLTSETGRQSLARLLKYGPEVNYWNEFVMQAYHHHQFDAIFLTGIPDQPETLPHAS